MKNKKPTCKSETEIKYGIMPIRKYKKAKKGKRGHYHVIVDSNDDQYFSVGLTSDNPKNKRNQKLHKVYESNGKIARMKRSATIDKKSTYSKNVANFNIDIESEKKASIIIHNKSKKK